MTRLPPEILMATIRKRGDRFRAIVKRSGFPPTSRTCEHEADVLIRTRQIEREMDRGQYLPRAASEGILMRDLIDIARKRGIRSMFSIDANENERMRVLAR